MERGKSYGGGGSRANSYVERVNGVPPQERWVVSLLVSKLVWYEQHGLNHPSTPFELNKGRIATEKM